MIHVTNLSKIYHNGKGIFDVNFSIAKGEAFGFLGPNGAGKTTTIRVLLGFTTPAKGSCTINGLDCRTQTAKIQQWLGYVPGEIAFPAGMTGGQFLQFMGDMRGIKEMDMRDDLIQRFELDTDLLIHKMSKGTRQKLALIAAFMHDPSVLILDEPTSGLDPLMQRRFVELILAEKGRGKTILMSSHQFHEIETTCTRAAIIAEGKIAAVEDIITLKTSSRKSYLVTVASQRDVCRIMASGLECSLITHNQVEIFITHDYTKMLSTLAKCQVSALEAPTQTLEQTFIRYYGKGTTQNDMGAI